MSKKKKSESVKYQKQIETPAIIKHPYLVIFALIFIVYVQTIGFDFVYLDDDLIILDNFDKISSISNIPESFITQYGFNQGTPYYRPIINISFILNAQLSGKSPSFYHVSNLVFHFIAAIFLFILLIKLGFDKTISLLMSLLFSVHPLLTNAVVWIVGRNDLLACLFTVLSFIYFIKYLKESQNKNLYLHSLFYLIAMFSKEVAIVLPVICTLFLLWIAKEKSKKKIWVKLSIFWLLPLLISQSLKYIYIAPAKNVTYGLPALIANIRALPEAIFKIFIPVDISVLPTFSEEKTAIGTLFLIGIFILPIILKKIDKKKYYFGIFWFLLFTLPGLFIIYSDQKEKFEYLDSRIYLPLVGIIISLGELFYSRGFNLVKKNNLVVGIILITLFSILTFFQSKKYENAIVFAESAVESNPEKAFFYRKLADYYFTQEKYDKAIDYLNKTISKSPDNFQHYKNLGLAYYYNGNFNQAIQVWKKAIQLHPKEFEVLEALMKVSHRLGRYDESLYYAKKIIEDGGRIDQSFYEQLKSLQK